MKQYKGYYIDNVIFHNEKEIDTFLEKQAVDAYKLACKVFAEHSTMENSLYCEEKAERLVNTFGYTWEQVEEIEIEVYKTLNNF